jgi:initiation factor 1A
MSIRFKDEFEEYGIILQAKGNARFECNLLDGSNTIAKAKGSLIRGPKKQKLFKGDLILVQLDLSSTEKKYYIVHKYDDNDKKVLIKNKEIPKGGFESKDSGDVGVTFDQEEEVDFEDI